MIAGMILSITSFTIGMLAAMWNTAHGVKYSHIVTWLAFVLMIVIVCTLSS